ncbi:MAG: hypothetical protein QXX08_00360 [Candidatus Bathyarchaeia archaeon]
MSEDKIIAFIKSIAEALRTGREEYLRAYKEALIKSSNTRTDTEIMEQKRDISDDYLLIETAKKIGIDTEGKTKEEISRAIIEKFQVQGSSNKTV